MATGLSHLQWMVSDDGSLTLWDDRLQESFHGSYGAVSESIIIYLVNGGVIDRLASREPTHLFEVGLGTATNMLLTAALAEVLRTPLEYSAVEPHLLPSALLQQLDLPRRLVDSQLQSAVLTSSDSATVLFSQDFQSALERVTEDFLSRFTAQIVEPTQLSLGDHSQLTIYPSVLEVADVSHLSGCMNVVYFDAFSPKNSPELWNAAAFRLLYDLLTAGGQLATYCVKGSVRRDMQKVGFVVRKHPGPQGGKREVLVASKRSATT